MKRDEILFSIIEGLNINTGDRSFDIPEDYIMFIYQNFRAMFLEQIFSKGGAYNDTSVSQTILLNMSNVDRSVCPIVPIGCQILSSQELPSSIIYTHLKPLIFRVGPIDILTQNYEFVEYQRVALIKPYTRLSGKNTIYYFVLNNRVFVYGINPIIRNIEKLSLMAIFSEPDKIINSKICQDCNEYPMTPQYHNYIIESVIKTLIQKYQIQKDSFNDGEDMPVSISQPKSPKE